MKPFFLKNIRAVFSVLLVNFFSIFAVVQAQDYESLLSLKGFPMKVYTSKGHENLGKHIANLVKGANQNMSELVGKPAPETTILILSKEDWAKYTNP